MLSTSAGNKKRRQFLDVPVGKEQVLLLVLKLEMLNVDGLLHLDAVLLGGFGEGLAGTELADGTGLFELALEAFESSLNIFAFLYGNDDHSFTPPFS